MSTERQVNAPDTPQDARIVNFWYAVENHLSLLVNIVRKKHALMVADFNFSCVPFLPLT
jgi:hypothetical protein